MDKAIIYARLSREDEDKIYGAKNESRSIENQIKILEAYAKEHRFYVYKVFYDDGVSGGTFDRPGLNQVFKEMEKGLKACRQALSQVIPTKDTAHHLQDAQRWIVALLDQEEQ